MALHSRRAPRVVALAALIGAAGVTGAFVHVKRVDWFVIPGLWREAKALLELKDPPDQFEPTAETTLVFRKLVEAQAPGFSCPESSFVTVRQVITEEGPPATIVLFAGDAPPGSAMAALFLLDEDGRILGRREAVWVPGILRSDALRERFPPIDPGWLELEGGAGRFHFRVAQAGLVPQGFILGLAGRGVSTTPPPVPVSRNVLRSARWMPDRDPRPRPSLEVARRRLQSGSTADVFRGLDDVERLDNAWAHLAVPLLSHRDPDVRARAAAVACNDPEQGAALKPLLADAAPQVRLAAAYALLNARDTAIAQEALAVILKQQDLELFGSGLDVNFRRLATTRAALEVISWLRSATSPVAHKLAALTDVFTREHLRAMTGDLISAWKSLVQSAGGAPGVRADLGKLLACWLAKVDSPACDDVMLQTIRRHTSSGKGPQDDAALEAIWILEALLERRTPLQTDGAVEVVSSITDFVCLRDLLLAWWKAPGAVDTLVRSYASYWYLANSTVLAPYRHVPPDAVAPLIEHSFAHPESPSGWWLWQALAEQEPAVLKPLASQLCRLWERGLADSWTPYYLVTAMVKADEAACDELVAKALADPRADKRLLDEASEAVKARGSSLRGGFPVQPAAEAAEE